MDLMPFDELNRLEAALPEYMNRENKSKADLDSLLDMLEDLFLLSYANGVESANLMLGADISADVSDVQDTVDRKIAGETWRDRVREYFSNGGSVADIVRIMETETHRDYNEAALTTARKAGAKSKTWHCMMLPTSRDTHKYLDGVSAPIDGEFYSFKGGKTQYPGQWGIAEEDVNCLCWLTFSK